MNYKIEQNDKKIYVTVTVPDAGTHGKPKPRHKIKKRNVMNVLKENGVLYGNCIDDPGILTNFDGPPFVLTKVWVFEEFAQPEPEPEPKPKPEPKPEPKRKTTTRRTSSKKKIN